MPDDRCISELTLAEQTSSSDLFETAIPNALSDTGYVSRKVASNTIALLIANNIQFTSQLQTTAKTLIGAINELAQGGSSSVILGTTDPTSQQGSNGNLYIKYDGTSYAVLGMWVKINDAWRAVELGGASSVEDLSDVNIVSLDDGQTLVYDEDDAEWKNRWIIRFMSQTDYDNLQTKEANVLYITDGTVVNPNSNMADAFSTSQAYAEKDLCIYNNTLYRFTSAKTAGAWDSTKVVATTLDAEKMRHIKDLKAGSDYSPAITPTSSHLLPLSDGTHEYKARVGEILTINTTPTITKATANITSNDCTVIKQCGFIIISVDVQFSSDLTGSWVPVLTISNEELSMASFSSIATESNTAGSRFGQAYNDGNGNIIFRIRSPLSGYNYRGQVILAIK